MFSHGKLVPSSGCILQQNIFVKLIQKFEKFVRLLSKHESLKLFIVHRITEYFHET